MLGKVAPIGERPAKGAAVLSRRSLLAGSALVVSGLLVEACRAQSASSAAVALTHFRAKGDRTDSPALERALAAGARVHLVAGGGLGAGGAYVLDRVFLKPNAWIEGDGPSSLVMPDLAGSGTCLIFDGGARPSAVAGITLRGFRMSGLQRQKGFAEHVHLVNFNGARSVRIDNMAFDSWQGDALYFGSGWPDGGAGHNSDVIVRNCTFDGLARQCRNAISVTSGSDFRIEDCSFANCSRNDMPGPVDFEINAPGTDSIANVTVTRCRFQNCGGSAAEISFIAGRGARNAAGRFEVSNNVFAGYKGTGAEIQVDLQRETTGASPPVEVVITGNSGSGGNRSLALKSAPKVTSKGNSWSNYRQPAIVGVARGETVGTVIVADRFVFGGGREPGAAVDLYDADTVDLTGSTFGTCEAPIKMTDGLTGKLVVSSDSFPHCTGRGPLIEQERSHHLNSLIVDGRSVSPTSLGD